MNEERIQELKQALAQIMNMIGASGEPLTLELMSMLVQALEHVATRIQELRAEGLSPTTPQLEPGPFPSSNINSFKYDPNSEDLYVKFHGKDTAGSGPTYLYSNIPRFIYDLFSRGAIGPKTSGQNRYHRWVRNVTPSLGGTMNALIKAAGYPYQRVA